MRAVLEGRTKMREVKVKTAELLEKVKANRTKHIEEYEEAVAGYKEAAVADIESKTSQLKAMVDSLQEGQLMQLGTLHFTLPVPENHAKDYDQVIQMLEMSVDDEMSIRSDEFACYVMDDWGWKEGFIATASNYTGKKF